MMLVIKQNIFKIRHIDNDEQTKPKIYLKFDIMIMMNQTKPKLYLKFEIMIMMNRTRGKHNYTNTSVRANRDLGKIFWKII